MHRIHTAGIALLLLASHAHTDEAAPDDSAIVNEIDRIVATSTLTAREQKDVASEVFVIDAHEIDRRQVRRIADLARYEPGVGAAGSAIGGGRFRTGGRSIRGLGCNRVRIEQDGIAIADAFEIGSFSSARRDVSDVDAIKRVEIVRGAASSLYGSDALAGVVSYVTKDPSDYVGTDGEPLGSVKFLYDDANRGSTETGTWAGATGSDGFVLVATHRDSASANTNDKIDSPDGFRTRPNPQQQQSNAALAKYVNAADSGRADRIMFDGERGNVDTDVR